MLNPTGPYTFNGTSFFKVQMLFGPVGPADINSVFSMPAKSADKTNTFVTKKSLTCVRSVFYKCLISSEILT